MPIEPGRLQHRITPQGATRVDDGEGGYTETSGALGTAVWGSVEPVQGFKRTVAMQQDRHLTHRVRVRYESVANPAAVESWLHEGRTLEVIEPPINEGERDELLTYLCAEVTG